MSHMTLSPRDYARMERWFIVAVVAIIAALTLVPAALCVLGVGFDRSQTETLPIVQARR